MITFVKFDYLAANSLIELEERKCIDSISFEEVVEYGKLVSDSLKKQNIRSILLISAEYTEEFLENYSELFEMENDIIRMKNKQTIDEIRRRILRYAPTDVLIAMEEEKSLAAIKNLTK